MLEAETRYTQLRRKFLLSHGHVRIFSIYILGKHISIETDHKPLVPLMVNKQLDNLPPSVLRFLLRLIQFSYSIHVPGKLLYAADTLSRAPLREESDAQTVQRQSEVEPFINTTLLPICQLANSNFKYTRRLKQQIQFALESPLTMSAR